MRNPQNTGLKVLFVTILDILKIGTGERNGIRKGHV